MSWHVYDKTYSKLESLVGICAYELMMSKFRNDVMSQQWVSLGCFYDVVFSLLVGTDCRPLFRTSEKPHVESIIPSEGLSDDTIFVLYTHFSSLTVTTEPNSLHINCLLHNRQTKLTDTCTDIYHTRCL